MNYFNLYKFSALEKDWWRDRQQFEMHLRNTITMLLEVPPFLFPDDENDNIQFWGIIQLPSPYMSAPPRNAYGCRFKCKYNKNWFETSIIFKFKGAEPLIEYGPALPTEIDYVICDINLLEPYSINPLKFTTYSFSHYQTVFERENCSPHTIISWCKQQMMSHVDPPDNDDDNDDDPDHPTPFVDSPKSKQLQYT